MTRLASVLVAATCVGLTASGSPAGPKGPALRVPRAELVTREVFLMGTRARLAAYAATRERGLQALTTALSVLERTESELSTWRDSSDLSTLNRHPVGSPWHASPVLCPMFAEVWRWHEETGGAFDPGIGRLLAVWDVHGDGAIPSGEARTQAAEASGLVYVSFDRGRCTLTRQREVAIDSGAFGKGEALDRVAAALQDRPWMVDLGGQVSVGGPARQKGWDVAIAHPVRREDPYMQLRLREGSLSTSGGSERDLTVNGLRVSHIFDPRTGQPASFTGSVTVWHRSGLAADALSTALYVMGPDEGWRWADARGVAAVYLIPEHGAIRPKATRAFSALE